MKTCMLNIHACIHAYLHACVQTTNCIELSLITESHSNHAHIQEHTNTHGNFYTCMRTCIHTSNTLHLLAYITSHHIMRIHNDSK